MEIESATLNQIFEAENFKELVKSYSEESANPYLRRFEFDAEAYKSLYDKGLLKIAVLKNSGKIVGFVSIILYKIPHFNAPIASVESIYLDKECRRGRNGLLLVKQAQKMAREAGAKGLYVGARTGSRFARLLEKIAEPMNVLFWLKS